MKHKTYLAVSNCWCIGVICGWLLAGSSIARAQTLGGIGAQLNKTHRVLLIKSVMADSPADHAGLLAGSKIISIDGAPTADMTLNDAVKVLRGAIGTTLKMEVVPPNGAQRELSLTRADIAALMRAGPAIQHRLLDNETGLLIVRGFGTNTADGVKNVLADFEKQGVRHVVLDLRNDSGGSLHAATDVASVLIGEETPLWKYRRIGSKKTVTTFGKREKIWNGDLLILVNAKTYLAAEMVASACQTSGRAKIWGLKTVGSATTYNLERQPDGTERRAAAGEFLTATGEQLQGRGITPDVPCDLPDSELFSKVAKYFSRPNELK